MSQNRWKQKAIVLKRGSHLGGSKRGSFKKELKVQLNLELFQLVDLEERDSVVGRELQERRHIGNKMQDRLTEITFNLLFLQLRSVPRKADQDPSLRVLNTKVRALYFIRFEWKKGVGFGVLYNSNSRGLFKRLNMVVEYRLH